MLMLSLAVAVAVVVVGAVLGAAGVTLGLLESTVSTFSSIF